MKYLIVVSAVLAAMALSACDKPTVVVPPPAVITVPVPGPAGPAGATGAVSYTHLDVYKRQALAIRTS